MTVEDPFFEDSSKREEIITNISSMPDSEKQKYSYIWMAELGKNNADKIVQFDTRGNENNYSDVREKLNQDEVHALYWVPVEADRTGYGVKTADIDSMPGLIRRGYIIHNASGGGQDRGYAYRIKAGEKYLYVSDDGETTVTKDENLNIVEHFNER